MTLRWTRTRSKRWVAETSTHSYEVLSAMPRYWSVWVRAKGSASRSLALGLDDVYAARRIANEHARNYMEETK